MTPNFPELNVPDEIKEAAIKIETWMIQNGWSNWRIYGISDRRLTDRQSEILKSIETLSKQIPR